MAVRARPLDLAIQVSLHYLPPCSRAIWHVWVILLVWITPVPGGGYGGRRPWSKIVCATLKAVSEQFAEMIISIIGLAGWRGGSWRL